MTASLSTLKDTLNQLHKLLVTLNELPLASVDKTVNGLRRCLPQDGGRAADPLSVLGNEERRALLILATALLENHLHLATQELDNLCSYLGNGDAEHPRLSA